MTVRARPHPAPLATLLLALLLVACGRAEPPAPTATVVPPTATSAPTATAVPSPTATATRTPRPTATPSPTPSPTPAGIVSLADSELIESFRYRLVVDAPPEMVDLGLGAAVGNENVGLEMVGAVVKEPLAREVEVSVEPELLPFDTLLFRDFDDASYVRVAGEWVEIPPGTLSDLDMLVTLDASEFGLQLEQLERVGEETLNGRETVRYRGDIELLRSLSEPGIADLDLGSAEEGRFDLWIDQTLNLAIRTQVSARGTGLYRGRPQEETSISLTIEYFDINAPITIEVPEPVG